MGLEEETIMLEETGIEREVKGKKVETAMKQAGLFFFLLMILELPYALLVNYVQMQFRLEYDTGISADHGNCIYYCYEEEFYKGSARSQI